MARTRAVAPTRMMPDRTACPRSLRRATARPSSDITKSGALQDVQHGLQHRRRGPPSPSRRPRSRRPCRGSAVCSFRSQRGRVSIGGAVQNLHTFDPAKRAGTSARRAHRPRGGHHDVSEIGIVETAGRLEILQSARFLSRTEPPEIFTSHRHAPPAFPGDGGDMPVPATDEGPPRSHPWDGRRGSADVSAAPIRPQSSRRGRGQRGMFRRNPLPATPAAPASETPQPPRAGP